jgi:mgtE-like transporter
MKERTEGRKGSLTLPLRWFGRIVRFVLGTPARAARGTARIVADPARQVVDYWRSERQTVRQGFFAVLIASLTSLVAGVVLANMDGRIDVVDGLFILIPVSIGMRGNIFGALSARLGTSIHSGLFEVSRTKEGILFQNVYAATLLTIGTSVAMGLLARAIAGLLGIDAVSVWDLILISLIGGLLSSAVVLAVTVVISVQSYRRGWDLDSVGAPLITAIGDVVTLPCLALASYVVLLDRLTPWLGAVCLVIAAVALVRGWTSTRAIARRVVQESFPILLLAIVLDVLAGTVVEPRMDEVFLPYPALLLVIPGFLENTGALGSILAARLGSKLHLGAVTPRAKPEPAALLDGTIILVLGMVVYTVLAFATFLLSEIMGVAHPGIVDHVGATLTGGILATLIAAVIGYYAATATYRFGFDPDNHTIPLVTSGMDLLGVICLVVALSLFGVA